MNRHIQGIESSGCRCILPLVLYEVEHVPNMGSMVVVEFINFVLEPGKDLRVIAEILQSTI